MSCKEKTSHLLKAQYRRSNFTGCDEKDRKTIKICFALKKPSSNDLFNVGWNEFPREKT